MPVDNLERRIATALSAATITATALGDLIDTTEAAIAKADNDADAQRDKAMDPTQSPDPHAARQLYEDALFAAGRLRTSLPRLQRKYAEAKRAEAEVAWLKRYEALRPEHTNLALELWSTYREYVIKLIALQLRARGMDSRTRALMQAKPDSRSDENPDENVLWPLEMRNLVLPDYRDPAHNAWPPNEPWQTNPVAWGTLSEHEQTQIRQTTAQQLAAILNIDTALESANG